MRGVTEEIEEGLEERLEGKEVEGRREETEEAEEAGRSRGSREGRGR